MLLPPAIILKLAREFLGLSQELVEAYSQVSRSSIQRIERGQSGVLNSVEKLVKFYAKNGIVFLAPEDGRGWGIINNNTLEHDFKLNKLPPVELPRHKVPESK